MIVKPFLLTSLVATVAAVAAAAPSGATAPPPLLPPSAVTIGVDLPMDGGEAPYSGDTLAAINLVVEQAGGVAGSYAVTVKSYDDSTPAKGIWDDATCVADAHAHVANAAEVAVIGTVNSGCAKLEVPILNKAAGGPLAMISHNNTDPGLLRPWDTGEPNKYYPTGIRSYGRISTSDNFQGNAAAIFARTSLHRKRCFVVDDREPYGVGVARAFRAQAAKLHLKIAGTGHWSARSRAYKKLWAKAAKKRADCVFLGGDSTNNGARLIKDKVAVLGSNKKVRLLADDGFSDYPDIERLKAAQNMYITYADIPNSDEIAARGAWIRSFMTAFQAKTGHAVRTFAALYGAAVAQLMLKAIAQSDGTRTGVRTQLFSGVSIPANQSLIGAPTGIDASGETITKEITMLVLLHKAQYIQKEMRLP